MSDPRVGYDRAAYLTTLRFRFVRYRFFPYSQLTVLERKKIAINDFIVQNVQPKKKKKKNTGKLASTSCLRSTRQGVIILLLPMQSGTACWQSRKLDGGKLGGKNKTRLSNHRHNEHYLSNLSLLIDEINYDSSVYFKTTRAPYVSRKPRENVR